MTTHDESNTDENDQQQHHDTSGIEEEAPSSAPPVVMDELVDNDAVGRYTGQVKWFQDKLGFGFITVCVGDERGKDIFVHHTGIRPLNSMYKTLRKGEYVNFNTVLGVNGVQAVDVTGIGGGSLMCDIIPMAQQPPQLPHYYHHINHQHHSAPATALPQPSPTLQYYGFSQMPRGFMQNQPNHRHHHFSAHHPPPPPPPLSICRCE